MATNEQIAALTTATTNLLREVVGQKDRLTILSDDAATDAASATQSAGAAAQSATAAATSAAQATQITGLATVADAVDLTITNEYLTARTQGDVDAERSLKRERFAGSGWEHFGKHTTNNVREAINQGLWSDEDIPNILYAGRNSSPQGDSKTNNPVMQMAGFTVEIDGLNRRQNTQNIYKFPEAPTGAVTYDSATGTVFDFETQSDPKYGNIAPDRNEAVSRAFEGFVSNGDFRFGDNGSWQALENASISIGSGRVLGTNTEFPRLANNLTMEANTSYIVEFTVSNFVGSNDGLVFFRQGSPFVNPFTFSSDGRYSVTVDVGNINYSQVQFTRSGNVDIDYQVSDVSIRPTTNQVVTRRVDMWGFEGFLEEVNTGNPFVYPNGLIQSQATTMTGIATVTGTRPVSYYAVFDGDTGSVGRGVDFFAATAARQEAMLNDPKNNLYRLDDGRLVQFRVRQRTIAGAGNGDWTGIQPFAAGSNFNATLSFDNPTTRANRLYVHAQGHRDALVNNVSLGADSTSRLVTANASLGGASGIRSLAAFSNSNTPFSAGEVHFLVGGTVSRLNQGAYHPEHNSFGSKRSNNNGTGFSSGVDWSSSAAIRFTSLAQCFNQVDASTDSTTVGAAQATGSIGAPSSGRTNDGRLFDAIYADGLGGVVDYRWSANDRSDPKWGAKAKLEAESGEYRGLELLQRTVVRGYASSSSISSTTISVGDDIGLYEVGDTVYPEEVANYPQRTIVSLSTSSQTITLNAPFNRLTNGQIVHTFHLDVSVSGNFTRTDTVADPVRLLATFPTGIDGGWIDTIPDGSVSTAFQLTRKALSTSQLTTFTDNNGATWGSATPNGINTALNQLTLNNQQTTRVRLDSYTADAKKTRRTTNTALLNAQSGQYGVTATASSSTNRGGLLFESMLGKVATSTTTSNGLIQTYPFMVLNLRPSDGNIDPLSGRESQHAPLMLAAPTNDSRGIKYAAHQVNDNGQATLNFIFNELDHDGTDWGDDSRLRVLNGTYTNQNGVTGLLADVDELAIPYGLIKNEV